jgi:uncharacterized protein (DUF1501 family)
MNPVRTHSSSVSVTRRGFIRLGAGSVVAWTLAAEGPALARPVSDFRCIFLNLVGGPSQLDTWDPKPNSPSLYRGPFRAIRTNAPGIWISELFPRMARLAQHFALVRSVFHDEAPIHETGLQLVQTGGLAAQNATPAHVGRALATRPDSSENGSSGNAILLPGPMHNTGVQISHGQNDLSHALGWNALRGGAELAQEPTALREQYGLNHFGQSCLLARRLVEQGNRCVTVNMFDTVYDGLSWDCHADGTSLNVKLQDYQESLAPMFDLAYSALLLDLHSRGMLQQTLVVATGEFGRTPKINLRGGRDHWTGAWTALFAGGGVRGGQVIGSTDRHGSEPRDRPVHASAIARTVLFAAGLPGRATYPHGEPVRELFGATARLI